MKITFSDVKKLIIDIPNENFIKNRFTNGEDKCCVSGHITRLLSGNPKDYNIKNCSDLDHHRKKPLNAKQAAFSFLIRNRSLDINRKNLVDVNNWASDLTLKDDIMNFIDEKISRGY